MVLLTSGVAGVPTFPVLLGVVAAVLGLGLVVGSFLRAGRGLIPFAVLVSLLIWGALAAPWHRFGRRTASASCGPRRRPWPSSSRSTGAARAT